MITLAHFLFSFTFASADPRLDGLVTCATEIPAGGEGRDVRSDRGSVFVADHDEVGWSVLVFGKTARRCRIPAAIQACFRGNPNCPTFEFLIARPEARDGFGLVFDGRAIDDAHRTARLGARIRALPKGTVDEKGRVTKTVRAGPNPLLGLACVEDRTVPSLARFERALATDLASVPHPENLAACAAIPALAAVVDTRRRGVGGPGIRAPEDGAPAAAH